MKNEVTCLQLWNRWQKESPNSLRVIETQRRISNYEKADWEEMIIDANLVIDKLKYLVVNDIDINSLESAQALDYLEGHVNKYFFDVDTQQLVVMKLLLRLDRDYKKFFNGFQYGLADRLASMIDLRVKQLIS
jgi:hypothetical protein